MALLFISSLVPDKEKYWNKAFSRSGNNVLLGIEQNVPENLHCSLFSFMPVPSFPNGPFFIRKCEESLESGRVLQVGGFLNLKIIKDLWAGLSCLFKVPNWSRKNKGEENMVLVYNIYTPSIPLLYLACKIAKVRLYAILYDLGVPPKRLGRSKLTMLGYRISEYFAKKYIPKLDGRIVINERIIKHYAPGKDYLLIDGGINKTIINNLPSLEVSKTKEYVFVCAGMLWDQNGTKLILDALKICNIENIRVVFAGRGNDVPLIEAAAKNDARISYKGMLTTEELFKVYASADVLFNLRIEEEEDFHFPSKLLECLAVGKMVLSTSIAHAERDYGDFMMVLNDVTPQGLAEKINEIVRCSKEELFIRGKEAREYMLKHRTWEARTQEILKYMQGHNNM